MAKKANIAEVYAYFSDGKTNGYTMAQFRADWSALSDTDKAQIAGGIGDGTLNY